MRVLAVADDLCTRKAGCVAGTGGSTGIAGGGRSFGRAMTDEEQLPSDVGPDSYAGIGEEWRWIESSNCPREKRLRKSLISSLPVCPFGSVSRNTRRDRGLGLGAVPDFCSVWHKRRKRSRVNWFVQEAFTRAVNRHRLDTVEAKSIQVNEVPGYGVHIEHTIVH